MSKIEKSESNRVGFFVKKMEIKYKIMVGFSMKRGSKMTASFR